MAGTAAPPPGGWPSVFAVYVDATNVPPLLGSYSVDRGTLVFRSQYPLAPGVRYRAVFHQPGQRAIEQTFNGPPKSTTPTARVEQVYPSADVLPSNQLRLYIYFSAPMSRARPRDAFICSTKTGANSPASSCPGRNCGIPTASGLR